MFSASRISSDAHQLTRGGRRQKAFATSEDGVDLYYEEIGIGESPILFIHEFAGDHRSWEPQIRFFAQRHRCIVYDARGYPPSDVPEEPTAYSQDLAVADALAVLNHLEIERAHVVGLSMGGFAALHLGLRHPGRTASLVVAACGYGAHPRARAGFREESKTVAQAFESEGASGIARKYGSGPARIQFMNKDPRGWQEFVDRLSEHSTVGSALTMLGVQRERPSLYDLMDDLRALTVPTLLMVGDEDTGCLEANLMLKESIRSAGLWVLPRTGHTLNLEEPDLFNTFVSEFLTAVEAGRWEARDPRSVSSSLTGISG